MFVELAVRLVSHKAVCINTIINTIYSPASTELLFSKVPMPSIIVINEVLVVEVTLFLRTTLGKFSIFVTTLEGRCSLSPEVSIFTIEVDFAAFIIFLIVEIFSSAGFVFVVRIFEALDDMSLLVSFLFVDLTALFTCGCLC